MLTETDDITKLVDKLFCSGTQYGNYVRCEGEASAELLRNILYQFTLESLAHQRVSLQVFRGIGGIGGQLWEQEVRALQRISTRQHPALPQILDGGFDEESDIAFIITEAATDTLSNSDAMEFIREKPQLALKHLVLLADALSHMHGNGLLHRNLSPGSVEIVDEGAYTDEQRVRLRLCRFEMSTLLTNLLRRHKDTDINQPIRTFFIEQGPSALISAPPERLNFLFAIEGRDSLEEGRSDVFSLGMLAYQWFVGLLDPAELDAVFAKGRLDQSRRAALIDKMRQKIASTKLPKVLRDLLRSMLEEDIRSRPTSAEIVRRISQQYESMLSFWDSSEIPQTFLLTYIPREMANTLYKWSWISQDPSNPTGGVELQEFIQRDLRGGTLTFSSQGFSPFGSGVDAKQREARFILIGQVGVYFAALYQHMKGWSKSGQEIEQVLIIKYVIERGRASKLERNLLKRRLPDVRLFPMGATAIEPKNATASPSWKPLLESVEERLSTPPWHQAIEDALQWLLDLQQVELDSRKYAYIRESQEGEIAVLCFDKARDRERISKNAFLSLFASDPDRRPELGDFFEEQIASQEEDGGESQALCCRADDQGRPSAERGRTSQVRFVERLDPHRIRVTWYRESPEIPVKGWVYLSGDEATDSVLRRQSFAYRELLDLPTLIDQLHRPTGTVRLRREYEDAGKGLRGTGPEIVQQMLESWPFFALHGPPGTGKTTITAYAVEAALRENRSYRVLIAAQSHYALDNLAEKIVARLKKTGLGQIPVIRIASQEARERVSEPVRPLFLESQTKVLVERIHHDLSQRLKEGKDPPAIKKVIGRWRDQVQKNQLEVLDRIRRGANIVFVTCGAATPRQVDSVGSFGVYDWVIIEEAAKAWPTELAMPLVRGTRWTLIGDHRQLPAYRRKEVEDMLQECATSPDERLRQHAERREQYVKVFDLFAQIFLSRTAETSSQTPRILKDPRGELRLQFRMREPIAEVVSQAFYDGDLKTDPSTEKEHALKSPAFLTGQALIWLDTSALTDALDRPCWQNPREADIVSWLVSQLSPKPKGPDELALLSPYRDQVRRLKRTSRPAQGAADYVHTVDSFQGREANIVIVSMVRNNKEVAPRAMLGHLTNPERVNVLFSRAMRLLIIIGALEHYERSQIPFWLTVCKTVRERGTVKSISDVGYPSSRRLS